MPILLLQFFLIGMENSSIIYGCVVHKFSFEFFRYLSEKTLVAMEEGLIFISVLSLFQLLIHSLLTRPPEKAPAYNRMEYICELKETGCWGCFHYAQVGLVIFLTVLLAVKYLVHFFYLWNFSNTLCCLVGL